jgi:hypothetical protein
MYLSKYVGILLFAFSAPKMVSAGMTSPVYATTNLGSTLVLHSWKDSEYCFSFVPGSKNGLWSLTAVTDPNITIHGILQLKKRLLNIPPKVSVFWREADDIGGMKDDVSRAHQLLRFPPKEVVFDIYEFALKNKIKLYLFYEGTSYSAP